MGFGIKGRSVLAIVVCEELEICELGKQENPLAQITIYKGCQIYTAVFQLELYTWL